MTTDRMARGLIDPNEAPLWLTPRNEHDLMIAAANGWVVAFDNLSGVPPALSDALCCLATGGGFGTRQLYTDDEEKLFSATRPVLLNGIEDIATRSDLLDRAIALTLTAIPDKRRRDEDEIWRRYEKARPRVLGALHDAVSAGLRNLPSVRLDALPRMADFAKWVTASEPALGWEPGHFMGAYTGNRATANEAALESSPVVRYLLQLVDEEGWSGTAGDLLAALRGLAPETETRLKVWPQTARGLSGVLRRLAPNLRRSGVSVQFTDEWTRRGKILCLDNCGQQPLRPSQPLRPQGEHGLRGDRGAAEPLRDLCQPWRNRPESAEEGGHRNGRNGRAATPSHRGVSAAHHADKGPAEDAEEVRR